MGAAAAADALSGLPQVLDQDQGVEHHKGGILRLAAQAGGRSGALQGFASPACCRRSTRTYAARRRQRHAGASLPGAWSGSARFNHATPTTSRPPATLAWPRGRSSPASVHCGPSLSRRLHACPRERSAISRAAGLPTPPCASPSRRSAARRTRAHESRAYFHSFAARRVRPPGAVSGSGVSSVTSASSSSSSQFRAKLFLATRATSARRLRSPRGGGRLPAWRNPIIHREHTRMRV